MSSRGFESFQRQVRTHGIRIGSLARGLLRCWLRFRCGCLSFARPFRRLWSSSVTNSTDFMLLFGSGRSALATFLAFLTQLLLVQIGLVLFIGKTTAKTSGGNGQCRCNFYWPATRYHMPRAFIQRIAIRKRKLTITRSTLMRHSFSYRGRLRSSNAEVTAENWEHPETFGVGFDCQPKRTLIEIAVRFCRIVSRLRWLSNVAMALSAKASMRGVRAMAVQSSTSRQRSSSCRLIGSICSRIRFHPRDPR